MSLKGNWSDGTPVKLRFVVTSCKLAFPDRQHCESCYKRQPDYWGPRQFNMHNLCIRACCNCIHHLETFDEQKWKEFCDWIGYDFSSYSFSHIPTSIPQSSQWIREKMVRVKRCKMCKEDDAEIGNYCEACHSFRTRNNLPL